MKISINVKKLTSNLKCVPEASGFELNVNKYLLNNIVNPFLNGEAVFKFEIDFGAFELDDFEALDDYLNERSSYIYRLSGFNDTIKGFSPIAVSNPAFC